MHLSAISEDAYDNPDNLDYDDPAAPDPFLDDKAITDAGYDSRATPVDTLMGGSVSMSLRHAFDMEHGDYSSEYANV